MKWVLVLVLLVAPALGAEFVIHPDQPAGPRIVGFGAEMNPYLHCKPNDLDAAAAKAYEEKVIALSPQHVRIFVLLHWFDGVADGISKGDPRTGESFLRACELAQRTGATINLTLWYGPWTNIDGQMKRFAELLAQWVNERKLTAIQYVTIQNEVNGGTKVTLERYTALYRALDGHLKAVGLRDRIKIISGDLVQDDQEKWFKHIGATLAEVSDGYSMHAYWDYWDIEKPPRRLKLPREIVDALPTEQQRPLYITEFGVRGHRAKPSIEPGDHEDGTPIALKPLQANQLAAFIIGGLNRGYVAFVVWTMEDAWYDRLMPYGLMGTADKNWPLKPSYHMVRLFTHTAKPGWRPVKVEGRHDEVVVAAATDGKALTVYALNTSTKPQKIALAGLEPQRKYNCILWNESGTGIISRGEAVRANVSGGAPVQFEPLELKAITTVAPQLP